MEDSYQRPPNAFRARYRIKTAKPARRTGSTNQSLQSPMVSSVKYGSTEPAKRQMTSNVYGFRQRQYDYQAKDCYVKYKYMFESRPEIKLDALPQRIPMYLNRKVPGRLFQKHVEFLSDGTHQAPPRLSTAPPTTACSVLHPLNIPSDVIPERESISSKLPQRPKRVGTADSRHSMYDFSTLESEIFAISFKDNERSNKHYDPDSELHSDYYSIRRLPIKNKRSVVNPPKVIDASLLLQGYRKELHTRDDEGCVITSPEANQSRNW